MPVKELCRDLLSLADDGLSQIGVDEAERKYLLEIIRNRLDSGITPAEWQRQKLKQYGNKTRPDALAALVEEYLAKIATGKPLTEW